MKNSNFSLTFLSLKTLTLISALFISFSCEKDTESTTDESTINEIIVDKEIESDIDFILMRHALTNSMTSFHNSLKSNNISLAQYKELYLSQDQNKLVKVFKENKDIILSNLVIAQKHWKALSLKYPNLKNEATCSFNLNMTTAEAKKALKGFENMGFIDQFSIKGGDCGWRYYVCLVAVGAPAVACAISTGGMAAYLCVLGYGAGAVLCFDTYCHL